MEDYIILFIPCAFVFIIAMVGMYLVKDYRKGHIYKGLIGKIQNFIKH